MQSTDNRERKPPRVSVVIPTCNRSAILARCLAALCTQTVGDFEVIVVDDASDDDTTTVVSQIIAAAAGPAVRYFRNERPSGANPSRNRAIAESRGSLIAFLDDDCIARPDWLERLIAPMNDAGVVAATGRVEDLAPTNLFELTFKGTHRVHAVHGHATRLVAGNMCIRRDALVQGSFDEDRSAPLLHTDGRPDLTVSGRGDEEGLFQRLTAAGGVVRVAEDAVVVHEHYLSGRAFFRQAYRGGAAAARLVYKYYLPPRLDVLPFLLAYLSLPLALIHPYFGALPALFLCAAIGAIVYNDLSRKRKTPFETLVTFPLLLAYYQVRLAGYILTSLRLRTSRNTLRRVRLPRIARRGTMTRDQ